MFEILIKCFVLKSKATIDMSDLKIFNVMSYEDNEPILKDPNETCNRENLNLLCAYFILNDSDVEITKKITALFKKLCLRLPYLVNKKLIFKFLFQSKKIFNFKSVLFFSLYINKLKISSNQNIVYHLVTTFIDLIVPKVFLILNWS